MDRAFYCRYSLPLPSGNDDFPSANPVRSEARHTSEQSAVAPACSIAPYPCVATWCSTEVYSATAWRPWSKGFGRSDLEGFFFVLIYVVCFFTVVFETAALSCAVGRWW